MVWNFQVYVTESLYKECRGVSISVVRDKGRNARDEREAGRKVNK